MAHSRGANEVRRFIAQLPGELETKVLRGAARAAATVVADEAKVRSVSSEVSAAVKVRTRLQEGGVIAKVQVNMGGYNLPLWLEYGTGEHFISVDETQRQGRSVGRINQQLRQADGNASLVIGGNFVGRTVKHPGARPHPFLRPALDTKEDEAFAAAQGYINSRVTRSGIVGSDAGDDE